MTSTEDIMKEIMDDPFANVTFSGGDPIFQAEGFAELLKLIDVLVDGPFMKDLRDEDLFFRGSSNQRLINVKKSLETGKVVELHLTKENPIPDL